MDGNAALESVDRLNSHLNSALIQIGRTFRDANGADSKLFGISRGQEQRNDFIAKANGKFHEVLDEVEIDILQAKAVIEKDLNAIRVAREEKERAIDFSKGGTTADVTDMLPAAGMGNGADLLAGGLPDADMLNLGDFAAQESALDPATFAAIANGEVKADGTTALTNDDASKADAPAQAMAGPSAAADSGAQDPADTSADGVDATNALFDFDSMFGDSANSQPFDLAQVVGTGDARGGTPARTMADLFNDLGGSAGDFADLGASASGGGGGGGGSSGTAEDLDSLLPGLGSYVNVENTDLANGAGDDFAMIDLPPSGQASEAANGAASSSAAANTTTTATAGAQDGGNAAAGEANGASANDTTATDGNGDQGQDGSGNVGDMDDIFGDMLDVGNMDSTNLDDFDWNI